MGDFENICPICLGTVVDGVTFPCSGKHIFCAECLRAVRELSCPYCREATSDVAMCILKYTAHESSLLDHQLYQSCKLGHMEAVTLLCNLRGVGKASVDKITGRTLWAEAAWQGHVEIIRVLYEQGPGLRQIDLNEALMAACEVGHVNVIRHLCTCQNHCMIVNSNNLLLYACTQGHIDVVQCLGDLKANVTEASSDGDSVLTLACHYGHQEIVSHMCRKYDNIISINDSKGLNPLTIAAGKGHTDVVKILCENRADPNVSDREGIYPLNAASIKGHVDIIEYLCGVQNADENEADDIGLRPLMCASYQGHLEAVRCLCDRKADTEKSYRVPDSPLMLACENEHLEIVRFLCKSQNVNVRKNDEHGNPVLLQACWLGHSQVVNSLCDFSAEVNDENVWTGLTPIMVAAMNGYLEMAECLNERGANKDSRLRRTYENIPPGATALHFACLFQKFDMTRMLCEAGFNKNDTDALGRSPIFIAIMNGDEQTVRYLCDHGADLEQVNTDRQTPLHFANWLGDESIVRYLYDREVDKNTKDTKKIPFVDITQTQGNQELKKRRTS